GLEGGVGGKGAGLWGARGIAQIRRLVRELRSHDWLTLAGALGLTFSRPTGTLVVGALWTVAVGVWIGMSPRGARLLQHPISTLAAFPAPMLYPLVTMGLLAVHIPFSLGCVALMLLGAQWFFFSSRRRHTRLVSDWSSDVCSSD